MRHAILALAFVMSIDPLSAWSAEPIEGAVVMAAGGADTMYIWDATGQVQRNLASGTPREEALHALELSAARILLLKAGAKLRPAVRSVAVRAIYERSGADSPIYGGAVFTGTQTLIVVTADRKLLEKNKTAWLAALKRSVIPAGLKVQVLVHR